MTGFSRVTWSFGFLAALVSSAAATDLATLQQNYVDQRYGMFVCYNMSSYTNQEWASSGLNVNTFNPTASIKADTDQWAATAKAAGMKYGVLTTKHVDGYALWNTNQSTYDVAATSWYNDPASPNYHTDVVKSYVDSFRAQGLGVGLYYSIWDKQNGLGNTQNYASDPKVPQKTAAEATAYVKAELNQLLTSYGHIDVIWADAWAGYENYMGFDYVNYQQVHDYVKQISPNTLLLVNCHEYGYNNNYDPATVKHTDIVGYETPAYGWPAAGNTLPSEMCDKLASGWFYHTSNYANLQAASTAATNIRTSNSRNASYLLERHARPLRGHSPSAGQSAQRHQGRMGRDWTS